MDAHQRESIINQVKKRYNLMGIHLSERDKRMWAASEAIAIGRGGDTLVFQATGISRVTISKGKKELSDNIIMPLERERIRQPGGGRKSLIEKTPELLQELDKLIDPLTRGDPESPLRWTCKSTYKLSEALRRKGYNVCQKTVYSILQGMGYSLQSNRKVTEGNQSPDRDAQFNFIHNQVKSFQDAGQPVISVDAKKKENVGQYKNSGMEWEPKGESVKVNTYDFPDKEKGKACPYGIFDLTLNEGWVSVGISKDTAEFAVESIRRWWAEMGSLNYPAAKKLLITADGGGSNGYRVRLWKREIQSLANQLGISISICHFPPGTSKWNKIEHRMFSFISKNWRGRPLDSLGTIVNLISNTTTQKGLRIGAAIDDRQYEKGIKVSDSEMDLLNIEKDTFHGEWNYTIKPQGAKNHS